MKGTSAANRHTTNRAVFTAAMGRMGNLEALSGRERDAGGNRSAGGRPRSPTHADPSPRLGSSHETLQELFRPTSAHAVRAARAPKGDTRTPSAPGLVSVTWRAATRRGARPR